MVVTLKLKTTDFRLRTRSRHLADPTQLADRIFQAGAELLAREADGKTRFRLIGIGVSEFADPRLADPSDLIDPGAAKRAEGGGRRRPDPRPFRQPRRWSSALFSTRPASRRDRRNGRFPRELFRPWEPCDLVHCLFLGKRQIVAIITARTGNRIQGEDPCIPNASFRR